MTERQRQTDRDSDTETETDRDRQTDRQTDRDSDRETDRDSDRETETERQTQTDRQTQRERESVSCPNTARAASQCWRSFCFRQTRQKEWTGCAEGTVKAEEKQLLQITVGTVAEAGCHPQGGRCGRNLVGLAAKTI